MPMNLKAVRGKIKMTKIKWDDEEVEVGYYPAAMTPNLIDQVVQAGKDDNLDVISIQLEPLLAWWDVVEEEGGPRIKTDRATIKTLPIPFLLAVVNGIQAAMRPPASKDQEDSAAG